MIKQQFNPKEPNAVWCSNIPYIWTNAGFVYLTSIMDLYSRKIIAWVLSDTLETKWVVEAIEKAKKERTSRYLADVVLLSSPHGKLEETCLLPSPFSFDSHVL